MTPKFHITKKSKKTTFSLEIRQNLILKNSLAISPYKNKKN